MAELSRIHWALPPVTDALVDGTAALAGAAWGGVKAGAKRLATHKDGMIPGGSNYDATTGTVMLSSALTTTSPEKDNWNLDSSVHAGIYQLQLLSSTLEVLPWPLEAFGSMTASWPDPSLCVHEFLTPPSSIDVSEDAASVVLPTMGHGLYVDDQGQAVKSLSIGGTIGVRPHVRLKSSVTKNQISSLADKIPGPAIFKDTAAAFLPSGPLNLGPFSLTDTDSRGLPKGEVTGFDEAMHLKNLFRIYFDIKRGRHASIPDPTKVIMAWVDLYSYEFWHVVPVRFSVTRARSFTFEYRIQLKTIQPLSTVYTDAYRPRATKADTLFSVTRRVLNNTRNMFVDAKNIITKTTEQSKSEILGTVYAGRQAWDAAANVLLGTDNSLKNAYDQTAKGVLAALPEIAANEASKFLGNTGAAPSDTSTRGSGDNSNSPGGALANVPYDQSGSEPVDESLAFLKAQVAALDAKLSFLGKDTAALMELDTYGALNDIVRSMDALRARLASMELQTDLSSDDIRLIREEFSKIRTSILTGTAPPQSDNFGHLLDHRNLEDASSVGVATVGIGETIYDVSQRIFGTKLNYKILVLLNRLRWPYVADEPSDGVVSPGDALKYPLDQAGLSANNVAPKEGQSAVERYGTDIALRFAPDGMTPLVSPNGDFELVSGQDNLAQAVHIKHSTVIGSLTAHPAFGIPNMSGSRLTPGFLASLDHALTVAYVSDPRISTVRSIRSRAVADVIFVQSSLVGAAGDDVLVSKFGV